MARLIHDEIAGVLKHLVVLPGAAPGASACVAVYRDGRWQYGAGAAGTYSPRDPRSVSPETVYDLASLTKPVVASVVARLVRSGALEFSTLLEDVLPVTHGTPSGALPLELFLSHRAGLEAHVLLAPLLARGADARVFCAAGRRPECQGTAPADGFPPVYSDLGFILIGAALEARRGEPLSELVEREVALPLGLGLAAAARWRGRLGGAEFLSRVAPTEDVPERGGAIHGVVHDDNACALAGDGLAGHAGLFGTASDMARFGCAMVDAVAGRAHHWLGEAEAGVLVRPRPGGSLLAGFDGKASVGSSAGALFGPRSFGHLGFTGTSLWCDPDADVVVVLLTNRVCPTRENILIRAVRPDVHSALFGLAAGLRASAIP